MYNVLLCRCERRRNEEEENPAYINTEMSRSLQIHVYLFIGPVINETPVRVLIVFLIRANHEQ